MEQTPGDRAAALLEAFRRDVEAWRAARYRAAAQIQTFCPKKGD